MEINKISSIIFLIAVIFLISVIVLIVVIFLIIISAYFILDNLENANMEIQCCDGNPCTDTYYTPEDNLCHLVLCENGPLFTNKENCVYPGKILH